MNSHTTTGAGRAIAQASCSFCTWERRKAVADPELDELLNSGYRYALSLSHDPHEAEDLLHDACVNILDSGGPMQKGYLFTTIRNRFIDRYRRSRRVLFMSLESDREEDERNQEIPSDDRWEMPDIIASDHLRDALAELRPEERETIYLAVVEEYTAQEIADMTDRPRGTILSLLHRTRNKLRKSLSERKVSGRDAGQA